MATRLWTIGPTGKLVDVIEGVGAATSSAGIINLTVDLGNTLVKDGAVSGGTRTISRNEVLQAIETLTEYVTAKNWPPA